MRGLRGIVKTEMSLAGSKVAVACALLLLVGSAPAICQELDWKIRSVLPAQFRGVATLPSDDLTPAAARRFAESVIEEYGHLPFIHFELISREEFPPFEYMFVSHGGYHWWRMSTERVHALPRARLLVIQKNAVLEFSDGRGGATRVAITGTDPLTFATAAGVDVRLLQFAFSPVSASGKAGKELHVFASTTQPLTKDLGHEVYQRVARMLPFMEVTLQIRNDPWFIGEPGYPLAYPYGPTGQPPSREDYQKSSTLTCGAFACVFVQPPQ